jgi:hypothetical protein
MSKVQRFELHHLDRAFGGIDARYLGQPPAWLCCAFTFSFDEEPLPSRLAARRASSGVIPELVGSMFVVVIQLFVFGLITVGRYDLNRFDSHIVG